MSNKPIVTRPLTENESVLVKKFYENIAAQSDLMDKMSERLFSLELAIPGLYATVLKLIKGENALLKVNAAFYITFACWFLALLFVLVSLIPRKWNVDLQILKQDPAKLSESLGIEDFFYQTAAYKRWLIIASSAFFFVGIFCVIFTMG
jgi:hypothetical protein